MCGLYLDGIWDVPAATWKAGSLRLPDEHRRPHSTFRGSNMVPFLVREGFLARDYNVQAKKNYIRVSRYCLAAAPSL